MIKAYQPFLWGSIIPYPQEDRMSFLERVALSVALAGILIWTFPHATAAQVVQNKPFLFPVNELSLIQITGEQRNFLADALVPDTPPPPPDPRVAKLAEYLKTKNSLLSPEAETLLKQYHYRLIIGIAFAESNFCRHQIMPNNCWGIGGGRPEIYPTLEDGVLRANRLIQKYHEQGMITPKLMRNTWVGWKNDNWIVAVEQITSELEKQGL